ncbi:DUF2971 domain-containing protein [Pectobacterium carotovorum]|uniref:DUF2971 domain-containing protein n=1 Tax=Pectobacterium carotovorum TaxID=554 RepID=UPI00208B3CA1|nr:DUF2971 domain-containing protein [Pectobacterium carotovorum]GKV88500.1 hypothetical protein PEC301619_04820 [Pectobacterium carotovorum subsp. carotovorum]
MYKYLPPERIDVLINKMICFNNPHNFNDPFEFHALFEQGSLINNLENIIGEMNLLDQMDDEIKLIYSRLSQDKQKEISQKFLPVMKSLVEKFKPTIINSANQVYEDFNKKFVDFTRVLCLSEKKDNLLMWGHYADSHRGFVLEFDVKNSFFNQRRTQNDDFGYLRKVNYKKDVDILDPVSGNLSRHFLSKNQDWEYESEWRMLLPAHQANKKIEHSGLVFDLFSFPACMIKSVILGCKATNEFEKNIMTVLKDDEEYSHVKIFKCHRSNERYELIATPIEK